MQTSSHKTQENQDERISEEKDSLMMTIENLRARLLSERSISKAANERADELVKRVKELEEQLKVMTFQRKRAEKAALDVLSYLDSLGINDNSEVYGSDSNEEASECESNMDSTEIAEDDKNFESSENKGNDKDLSGSEQESTTPSGGSLSWKGRQESTQLFNKKGVSSSMRRRTSLSELHFLPRHRFGKSCRQIKRRELRSKAVESMHDYDNSDAQDSNFVENLRHCQDCLDFRNGKPKQSPERYSDRGSRKDEVFQSSQGQAQECDAHSTRERECNAKLERALQHQAKLIRSYEAQEKAQRDWEEKYGENNDSCEPGSHSDITEERDENKAAIPHPVEVDACVDHGKKAEMETNAGGEKLSTTQFNSLKKSPDIDVGSSRNHNFSAKQSSTSTPDFEFSVADNNQSVEHAGRTDSHGRVFCKPMSPQNRSGPFALVPHKEPPKLGAVLEALQEAKQVTKQLMNSFSGMKESVSKAIEISDPTNRDADWLKLPVRCPGLFRVPTDLDSQASNPSRTLSLDYPSSSSPVIARTAGHAHISKPTDPTLHIANGDPFISTPVFVSELGIINRQPMSEYVFPHQSSNHMYSYLQGNEAGKPPFEYPLFQNLNFRPNT